MADTDRLDIEFTLDGVVQHAQVHKKDNALPLLRDQLGCTTLKAGCSPQGVCGSCAAIVGGKPRLTCTLPAKAMNGKDILTQAGLGDRADVIARAFAAEGLAQDGYAVPGMLMACAALVDSLDGAPMDADAVAKALQLHACRSVGYDVVTRAFLRADEALRGVGDPLPPVPSTLVRAALGQRPSVDDLARPRMLHAAVVFAPHARCTIQAVDTDAAAAMDGVVDVLTAADLPASRTHGICISDWPVLVGVGETTRGCADLVAVVAAHTREQARAAAAAVVVQADALDPETSVNLAAGEPDRIVHRVQVEQGDTRAALDSAAHTTRAHVETRGSDPCFVEPEAALAVPLEDGRIRVYGAGLDLFRDLEQLASITGMDPDQLEVVHLPAGGGGGGARLDMGIGPHATLLAMRTGRPVKLALEMAEGTRMHAGRHPTWTNIKLGCDAQGKLTALHATIILDTGGHTGAGPLVADTIARHATLAYQVEHVDLDVLCVRSDNPAAGASPGLGVPEYTFAVETALDRLAAEAGLDPLELRRKNLLQPGADTAGGVVVPDSWAPAAVLDRLQAEGERMVDAGLTVGAALGVHIAGLPEDVALAELEVVSDGHVRVHSGFSEVGQGFDTRATALAAATTGLDAELFEYVCSTRFDLPCGPTLSARDRRIGLPAVAQAAAQLRAALDDAGGDLAALVGQRFLAEASVGPVMTLCGQAVGLDDKGAIAQVAVVADTGSDALDPHLRGLVSGAVEHAVEVAVMAEREVDDAAMPETRWTKLGVLKARFAPSITVVEVPGAAAGPLEDAVAAPTAAAIASALHAAGNDWETVLPMKATPVAKAMGVRPPRPAR